MRDDFPLIPTYTGKRIDPMALRPEDVDIRDIAHHLSLINRYNGATDVGFNVAQHSCIVSAYSEPEFRLAALLHDAPEAYIQDLTHPVKYNSMLGTIYRWVEAPIGKVIEEAFGLEPGALSHPEVKRVDEETFDREWACLVERKDDFDGPWLYPMYAKTAEHHFLRMYEELVESES
jgi:5'-deoxynucleotidase YfbR-like HD superfamily hydrolase